MRTLIERISRGKSLRRRLPPRFGSRPVFLSPDAALTYLKWNWAEASAELLTAVAKYVKPADRVWDIGGNVGVFSFAAAHLVGEQGVVVTLEADPFLAYLLQKSANDAGNADRKVHIICAAASHEQSLALFAIAQRGRASSALELSGHRSQAGGTRYVQYVPTITLDSLLEHFHAPQVIKIDVEGAEALVLRGATRVLSECRPLFYIEVSTENNHSVTDHFKRHGYRLYDGDAADGIELEYCVYNTLAVPNEQALTNQH